PDSKSDLEFVIIEFLGTFFIQILCILLAILLSISLPNGYTILGVLFFFIISSIAPFLSTLKFIFPNGYQEKLTNSNFDNILTLIFFIFFIYALIFYIISIFKFKNLEY
ncbi:TPA: hypothetical protein ACJHIK_002497, partial [Staphylococcus pseudintermedius]